MAIINDPKTINRNDGNSQLWELPLKSDVTTAMKYVEENNLGTYSSFTSNENVRFSNDGSILYNYYISGATYTDYWENTGITYEWRTESGHDAIITSITYS